MSSRDIEGENLLYLPQAKIYRGSCALGPWVRLAASEAEAREWTIQIGIWRNGSRVFAGETPVAQIKRTFEELARFLFRSQEFPHGAVLLTGTGIVPPDQFTLQERDEIEIRISGIGVLRHFDRERYEQVRQVAAEMMAEQSNTDCRMVLDLFSGEVGYATPKVDVRGVVFREDRILLVKERADGLWTVPGGWADVNESPQEAVERGDGGIRLRHTGGKVAGRLGMSQTPARPAVPIPHLQVLYSLRIGWW